MNAVRHRPVAEQYPSSTATVSALASKRISGMEGWSRRFSGNHASTHSATWRASHTAHHAETRAMVVPNIMRPATARVPHSRQRTEGRRAARARCRSDGGSCGLLAGGAQHGPLNVWPQVLATDGAIGGALDCRAALGWNGADPVAPLIYCRRSNADRPGQVGLPAKDRARGIDCLVSHCAMVGAA